MAMVLEDESITPDLILEKQIDRFIQTHADCEIVIQEYYRSDDIYEDGINRIQREISTGKGPDNINYGDGYSIADVTGRYTEDLYRFILDDKELQKDLFMNIIDTFAVNGALYAIPTSVQIQTCAGRKEELGDISDWDVSTMIDCFDKIGKKYPLGYNPKSAICTDILYASLDEFIDWKNGTNSFYSDEFKKILELADIYSDCQDKFENDKPAFLSLLEIYIDLDEIIPISFRNHFYASTGRPRKYPLKALLWALIIQRIFSIPTDQLLLAFLTYSKPLREFCGFTKVPDASKITRFTQDFLDDLQIVFDKLVDVTERKLFVWYHIYQNNSFLECW